jgi:predicted aspartyl protease
MTIRLALPVCILFALSCTGRTEPQIVFPPNLIIDTIPFASEPASNHVLLQASVGGESYNLTFDSGSPTTLVNSKVMSRRISYDTVFFSDLLLRQHPSFRVSIDTLQLGKLKVINMDSYLQRNLNFDGMLGDDIIRKFIWKFDLINRRMYVTDHIRNFQTTGISIPFYRKGEHIFITINIDNSDIELIVDTGYSGFITINKRNYDSLFPSPKTSVFWEGVSTRQFGNPYASSEFPVRIDSTYYVSGDLNVAGITLKTEIIELHHLPLNIIGMDFFKRFDHFILDYHSNMIHFGKVMDKSLDFLMASLLKMNTKGVVFVPSTSKAQIGRVTSWAKEKGLNYLDTILSIDGESIVNRDSAFYQNQSKINEETDYYEYRPSKFLQLWNDFHFIKDTSVIEVKRGDSSQIYKLQRQYSLKTMPDSLHDYYIDLRFRLPNIHSVKTDADSYYFRFKTEEMVPWGLRNKPERHITMAPEKP